MISHEEHILVAQAKVNRSLLNVTVDQAMRIDNLKRQIDKQQTQIDSIIILLKKDFC
jgi:hypothetical protein